MKIFESERVLDEKRKALGAGARLVEAYDLSTAKLLAQLAIAAGGATSGFVSGESLFISDGEGLVLAYSLLDGAPQGTWFGRHPTHSASSGVLALQASTYEVALYAAGAFEPTRRYAFSSPLSHLAFAEDGRRLLVLTADQSIYVFDPVIS